MELDIANIHRRLKALFQEENVFYKVHILAHVLFETPLFQLPLCNNYCTTHFLLFLRYQAISPLPVSGQLVPFQVQ